MYNPGVQFNPMPLYYGIAGAGDAVAQGLEKREKAKLESDYFTGVGDYYFAKDPELHAKFLNGSLGTKRGMVTMAQAQEARGDRLMEFSGRQANEAANRALDYYRVDKQFAPMSLTPEEKADYERAGAVPLRVGPHGFTALPVNKNRLANVPLGSDPTDSGNYYFDGRSLKQIRPGPLPTSAAAKIDLLLGDANRSDQAIADYQKQIEEHTQQIQAGDKRFGFLNFNSREAAVKDLQQKILEEAKKKEGTLGQISTIKQTYAARPTAPAASPANPAAAPWAGVVKPKATPAPTTPKPAARPVLGAPVEPPLPVKEPEPAPTAKADANLPQAQGGYLIGRQYNGMTYIGGDPSDPQSWQQAKM